MNVRAMIQQRREKAFEEQRQRRTKEYIKLRDQRVKTEAVAKQVRAIKEEKQKLMEARREAPSRLRQLGSGIAASINKSRALATAFKESRQTKYPKAAKASKGARGLARATNRESSIFGGGIQIGNQDSPVFMGNTGRQHPLFDNEPSRSPFAPGNNPFSSTPTQQKPKKDKDIVIRIGR